MIREFIQKVFGTKRSDAATSDRSDARTRQWNYDLTAILAKEGYHDPEVLSISRTEDGLLWIDMPQEVV